MIILKNKATNDISHLILNKENEWEVLTKKNERFEVELYGECIVMYFLIWLNFSTLSEIKPRKTFHVLLFPDSVIKDQLRQLRVRLRFLPTQNKTTALEE